MTRFTWFRSENWLYIEDRLSPFHQCYPPKWHGSFARKEWFIDPQDQALHAIQPPPGWTVKFFWRGAAEQELATQVRRAQEAQ